MKIITDDDRARVRTDLLMQDARLDPLIDRSEGYLKSGGAKTVNRAWLKMIVAERGLVYRLGLYNAEGPDDILYQQLAEPLARVIYILMIAPSEALDALEAPDDLALGPLAARRAAEGRHKDLLGYLVAILRAAQSKPPPAKNPRWRPAKTGNLRELVDGLADDWESATGAHFTPKWHRTDGELQAASYAAAFVYDIVCYFDEYALLSLRRPAKDAAQRLRNSRK